MMGFKEDHVNKVLKKIKKVRFADDHEYIGDRDGGVGEDDGGVSGVVRIKVVISKRELLEMIERGGVTVGEGVLSESRLLFEGRSKANDDDGVGLSDGWNPRLESISEAI
ncbi:hypothetical protein MLD38_032491 [Melastoma candidum]|uniref:Uncharacterized protein n=1 Tax=Melastoma candidum TaxID=119954 RepID=A0ACB9M7E4_9MYRT|nr:hypothetical protein MLD38_032491 [Melastoma candidum]